jgi:hypothetical protein
MANFISDFMNGLSTPIFGIPFFWFIAIFVGIIFLIMKFKGKPKEFKKLTIEEEQRNKWRYRFDVLGTEEVRKSIKWGYEDKGLIGRSLTRYWRELPESKLKEKFIDKETNLLEAKIITFEVYRSRIKSLSYIKRFFKLNPFYYVVNDSFLIENDKEIIISPTVSGDKLSCFIVFSRQARGLITDDTFRLTKEQELTELINWLPLQSYLSVQHAQSSEGLDHLAEIEKSKREETVKEMTGKKKR